MAKRKRKPSQHFRAQVAQRNKSVEDLVGEFVVALRFAAYGEDSARLPAPVAPITGTDSVLNDPPRIKQRLVTLCDKTTDDLYRILHCRGEDWKAIEEGEHPSWERTELYRAGRRLAARVAGTA